MRTSKSPPRSTLHLVAGDDQLRAASDALNGVLTTRTMRETAADPEIGFA
jgi:hypothetical protein